LSKANPASSAKVPAPCEALHPAIFSSQGSARRRALFAVSEFYPMLQGASLVSFNPLQERGLPLEKQFRNWRDLNVTPYDKDDVHPFGRCRGIVANGIEVESVMFSHSLARNTLDPG
jgi:hypothetical protein